MTLSKKQKIRRWIVRILLLLILLPLATLIMVRFAGWFRMRTSDKDIQLLLAPRQVSDTINTLHLRGRDIVYLKTTKGSKKEGALILVHGSPGSLDAFLEYMTDTALLARVDIIAYDRPGFGNSGFGKAEPTLSRQGDILFDLMKALGYKQYWTAGHSYGAPVILQEAISHPGSVEGICLIAGSISPEQESESVSWRKWIDLPLVRELLPVSMRVSNEELAPLRQDLIMIEDDWDRLTIPVSLIHGTKDVLVPFENLNYAREKLTRSDTVLIKIFEGENHFIPWTKKKEIVSELVRLIDLDKVKK